LSSEVKTSWLPLFGTAFLDSSISDDKIIMYDTSAIKVHSLYCIEHVNNGILLKSKNYYFFKKIIDGKEVWIWNKRKRN
jgi:hypothetical protein